MKRKLLTQMKNEWRDNIWLVIELMVVTGVIWLIALIFYGTTRGYFEPTGSDYEDVYLLGPAVISENSPYYTPTPEGEEGNPFRNDFRDILHRLRDNPHIEEIAFHNNALPYNYNFSGTNLIRVDRRDSVEYFANYRAGSPEIVKVLGFESTTGKTPDQLVEILRRGELLISDNPSYAGQGGDVNALIGAQMVFSGDSTKVYRVGDVIRNVRRSDFEPAWAGTIIYPLSDEEAWGRIVLKVKKGHDMRFKEDFRTHPELRRQRNVYFTDLEKLSDVRESCQREVVTSMRMLICLMGFLLVTVFLGLLGTFWFRMQQRVGEIAIRKVCGASRRDIFARIIGEGMILLIVASLVSAAVIWPFKDSLHARMGCSASEMAVFEFVSIFLVACGIVLSLWYPARKAMSIEPAIALKSE